MFCHRCGAKAPPDAAFCHKCGGALVADDAETSGTDGGDHAPPDDDPALPTLAAESAEPRTASIATQPLPATDRESDSPSARRRWIGADETPLLSTPKPGDGVPVATLARGAAVTLHDRFPQFGRVYVETDDGQAGWLDRDALATAPPAAMPTPAPPPPPHALPHPDVVRFGETPLIEGGGLRGGKRHILDAGTKVTVIEHAPRGDPTKAVVRTERGLEGTVDAIALVETAARLGASTPRPAADGRRVPIIDTSPGRRRTPPAVATVAKWAAVGVGVLLVIGFVASATEGDDDSPTALRSPTAASSARTASPSAAAGRTSARALVDYRGSGTENTGGFAANGAVQVCWEISYAKRPSNWTGTPNPGVFFLVFPAGSNSRAAETAVSTRDGCETVRLSNGRYFLRGRTGPEWVEWRVTVRE